jgi:protein-tyrosine kinase
MFGRKRAHLVERAVERLAQSGELDESAVHLLEPEQQAGPVFTRSPPGFTHAPANFTPPPLAAAPVAGVRPAEVLALTDADRHDTRGHDVNRHDTNRHDTNWHDPDRHDTDRHDTDRHDTDRHDTDRRDTDRHDTDRRDTDRHGAGAVALAELDPAPKPGTLREPVPPQHPGPGSLPLTAEALATADPPFRSPDGDARSDGPTEEHGPHTLIPREEGAGQPFVDMTSLFRAGMIDWNRVRSRVSEEFRLVQRQIVRTAFTAAGAEPGFSNLLMITSSIPGEGKSFTSLNLAACIARQRDHHVLLIDIDSKRDSFCMALGLGDAPGLLDLAANPELDATQVMARTAIENLSVLPIGIERDLGPELFASKQMTKLIQAIGRRYADRLIVLDAPPTLSTSDPAALAPIVGQVLFVVEAERTQREEVESSLDLLQACPTITLLLNKVQVQTRYTFGAYSTYYTS